MLEHLTNGKILEASDILHIAPNLNAYQLATDLEVELDLAEWLLASLRENNDTGSVMLKRDAHLAIIESR